MHIAVAASKDFIALQIGFTFKRCQPLLMARSRLFRFMVEIVFKFRVHECSGLDILALFCFG